MIWILLDHILIKMYVNLKSLEKFLIYLLLLNYRMLLGLVLCLYTYKYLYAYMGIKSL